MPRDDTQTPLLDLRLPLPPRLRKPDDDDILDGVTIRRRWYHFIPLFSECKLQLALPRTDIDQYMRRI